VGVPKTFLKERKNVYITVRVSETKKTLYNEIAMELEMPMSELIHKALDLYIIPILEYREQRDKDGVYVQDMDTGITKKVPKKYVSYVHEIKTPK